MKALKLTNKVCQILAIVAAVAAVVFFFFDFATITSAGKDIAVKGVQMIFKGSISEAGSVKLAVSADVWFCFWLSVLGVVFSALTFKVKGMRYASPFVTLAAGIYMLVIACSKPVYFVDARPLPDVTAYSYKFGVWAIMISLFVAVAFGVAHLLVDDYIIVSESKGTNYTIPQRLVRFFKDYKSEVKKIVWPNFKTVARNTGIVFAICAIIGVFIWAVDFGLAKLLDLLFK